MNSAKETCSINIDVKGGGKVVSSPSSADYPRRSIVSLKAVPDEGYKFSCWQGDVKSQYPLVNLRVDEDIDVVAVFLPNMPSSINFQKDADVDFSSVKSAPEVKPKAENCKINVQVRGGGKVVSSPNTVDYVRGRLVSLKAVPDDGSKFLGWQGDIKSQFPIANLRIDRDLDVVAIFTIDDPSSNSVQQKTDLKFSVQVVNDVLLDADRWVFDSNLRLVTDEKTKLMWRVDPESISMSYENAKLPNNLGGFKNWRLPTKEELVSITGECSYLNLSKGFYWTDSCKKTNDYFDGYVEVVGDNGFIRLCNPDDRHLNLVRYVRDLFEEKSSEFLLKKDNMSAIRGIFPVIEDSKYASFDALEGVYINNNDGTVSDLSRGLIWCALREPEEVTLSEAFELKKNFAGSSEWRMPTAYELKSITPIDEKYFLSPTRGYYFSSTAKKSSKNSLKEYELVTSAGMSDVVIEGSSRKAFVRFVRYSDSYQLSFGVCGDGDGVVLQKTISGLKYQDVEENKYLKNSIVRITAKPKEGSYFKGWHGDLNSKEPSCEVLLDFSKSIVAEFGLLSYSLNIGLLGSGEGCVKEIPCEVEYKHGSKVVFKAEPCEGSIFKSWSGDVEGIDPEIDLIFDGPKKIFAEFSKTFSLNVSVIGGVGGAVEKVGPDVISYESGTTVQIRAIPFEGYEFVCWHGDCLAIDSVFDVLIDADKKIFAEFRSLPECILDINFLGTGHGLVMPERRIYFKGDRVELNAKPDAGSVFEGWGGDFSGNNPFLRLEIQSNLSIDAIFSRLDIPETDISMDFDSVVFFNKNDEYLMVFQFNVINRSNRQRKIKIPLASYVTSQGEEVEQSAWVKGMIDGEVGVTLRAGTFRKIGLVFERYRLDGVKVGEHLHLTVLQNKPAECLNFVFRCTDEVDCEFTLINASTEVVANISEPQDSLVNNELEERMRSLEKSLQDALMQLKETKTAPPPPPPPPQLQQASTQTLQEIMAWLSTQNQVPVALLRQKLLPLGLMTGAVVDDVNERALDITGETALEENKENVIVQRGVLLQVLAAW